MINLLKVELMKIRKSKVLWLMVVIQIIMAIAVASTYISADGTAFEAEMAAPKSGYSAFFGMYSDTPLAMLLGAVLDWTPLLIMVSLKDSGFAYPMILRSLLVSFAFISLFTALTYGLYRKAELK